MRSVQCYHCNVRLKIDETKIPPNLTSFKCPSCKKALQINLILAEPSLASFNTDEPSTQLLRSAHSQTPGYLTVCSAEVNSNKDYPLKEGNCIVGRYSQSRPAVIGIHTNDRFMSREHFTIDVVYDKKGNVMHVLSDLQSKNATFHNGIQLEQGDSIVLTHGDEIVAGKTTVIFHSFPMSEE